MLGSTYLQPPSDTGGEAFSGNKLPVHEAKPCTEASLELGPPKQAGGPEHGLRLASLAYRSLNVARQEAAGLAATPFMGSGA